MDGFSKAFTILTFFHERHFIMSRTFPPGDGWQVVSPESGHRSHHHHDGSSRPRIVYVPQPPLEVIDLTYDSSAEDEVSEEPDSLAKRYEGCFPPHLLRNFLSKDPKFFSDFQIHKVQEFLECRVTRDLSEKILVGFYPSDEPHVYRHSYVDSECFNPAGLEQIRRDVEVCAIPGHGEIVEHNSPKSSWWRYERAVDYNEKTEMILVKFAGAPKQWLSVQDIAFPHQKTVYDEAYDNVVGSLSDDDDDNDYDDKKKDPDYVFEN